MKADFQLASAAYVRNIGHSLGAWVLCFWLFLLMLARPVCEMHGLCARRVRQHPILC
ncbi:hypothetical protein MtrunA17_Chr1g0184001 [Medicago truncatula]|uniref:Transmembrane protein n=1 Tax=Medicago truncatula TaxID=3880 RepID=A0A396JP27_MEDTR|nr:hypothetical protein MtrunA17_Chr1g0184001 [Medicago truncatula]